MKLFVWDLVDHVTDRYHNHGAIVVIAPTLERARELISVATPSGCEALTAAPDLVRECEGPEHIAIHQDRWLLLMTQPHLASSDTAITAAQARVRTNLETRARACFDAAITRPSIGAVEVATRALMALHHQWVAGLERDIADLRHDLTQYAERQAQMLTDCRGDCQGERPARHVTQGESDVLKAAILASSKVIDGGRMADIARAQSDFGRLKAEHRAEDECAMATGATPAEVGAENALIPGAVARQATIRGFGANPLPLMPERGERMVPRRNNREV